MLSEETKGLVDVSEVKAECECYLDEGRFFEVVSQYEHLKMLRWLSRIVKEELTIVLNTEVYPN